MDEIIDIQQNHNDGGYLLGKDGLIQLWKMINDKFISTDRTGLLQSKTIDHAFVDNISSKLDNSKITLTLPTYNLYTKTIGSVSAIIPAVSGSSAGLMTPTMLSTLNNLSGGGGGPVSKDDINKGFFTGVSKSGTDTVTLSFTTFNPSTKGTDTQTVSFDVGSSDSATLDDLSQCVKKSIIPNPTNQAIPIFDISLLPNNLLSFNGGSDNGTLSLTFYGSKDGETPEQMGYRAQTSIPAVTDSKSGLMTPAMLSTLNNLSGGGGGPVSKDDINKGFFTGVSKSGTDTVTLSFTTFNPSTKGTDTQTVSFDVGSSDSATKTDLAQCIKKSIIGSDQVISLFDISSLSSMLSFNSGSDNGTLSLNFNGSKDGETQEKTKYQTVVTIPAVTDSKSGLMTPALLNKLNSLSSGVDLTTADNRYIRKDISNAQEMSGTLTAPAFYMTSDIALKRDIIDTPLPDKIASRMIQFKQFKYKQDDDVHYGVVAQEIEKILPQLVHENDGTKIVDYISLLCLKIQDLQDQINELKSKTSK